MARSAETFRHLIREAAERYAVAPELIESVLGVESNFAPRAVSPKGSRGLMQLTPATAKLLGVQDVFAVHQNIDGGVRHLRNPCRAVSRRRGARARRLQRRAGSGSHHGGIPPYGETQGV